jgi:hypothetical protein
MYLTTILLAWLASSVILAGLMVAAAVVRWLAGGKWEPWT